MRRYFSLALACLVCGLLLAMNVRLGGRGVVAASSVVSAPASCPVGGCKDAAFSANPNRSDFSPTGEKPQSKLWYNDGRWWASMLSGSAYYIFYLDGQTWVKTTTQLDDRLAAQADCLWDSATNKLYVASGAGLEASGIDLEGRLYSYTYDPASPPSSAYTLDAGFPVTIRPGGAETLVIDKDSTGQLWTTYTQIGKVWVNHSTSADYKTWGTPFSPPMPSNLASGVNIDPDDISSLIAFDGKIGVLWSNQADSTFYYAIHDDSAAANAGWTSGIAWRQPSIADDHINLKSVQTDAGGNLFAVVKTSISGGGVGDPRILVLRRDPSGAWKPPTLVFDKTGDHTRPILLIDSANHRLYVFATTTTSGGTIVYKESTDYTSGTLSFPDPAVSFIQNAGLLSLNNATSTKQNVNGGTDIVVLASDGSARFYAHNVLDLPGSFPTPTPTPTRTPTITRSPTRTPTTTPSPTTTPRPNRNTVVDLPLLTR